MELESLVIVVIWIGLLGLLVWAIINYIPMDSRIKNLIIIIAVAGVLLWLVYFLMGNVPLRLH